MSGQEAIAQLLAEARREELVAVDLVARALRASRRQLLRDWRKRSLPETRVGRDVWLASRLVLVTYFPHQTPASENHSR